MALVVKSQPANVGDIRDEGSIPASGRFPEGGSDNSLQHCCLEIPRTKNRTWLKWLSTCLACMHGEHNVLLTNTLIVGQQISLGIQVWSRKRKQSWRRRKKKEKKQQQLIYWLLNTLITSLVAQTVKRLSTVRETWVWFLGREDPLEKEMATHSSILAWRTPWTEEPGGLQSMGSQRVGHDWATTHLSDSYWAPNWFRYHPGPLNV